MSVKNGSLVAVEAANFVGVAGLQGDTVAFVPSNVTRKLVPGDPIKVAGEDKTVRFAAPSAYVPGMLLVTFG